MGLEEQVEEKEVLASIFPDEITDVSDTAYRISIALDVHDPHASAEDEVDQPIMLLHVSYPPEYPDVGPALDLTNAQNTPRHPLLNVADDKAKLLESLDATIEENLGMAMVFTLVTTLKEAAETLIADRQRQAQEAKDLESQKAEEEENRKFHGTPVTKETFLEWRAKFKKETEERERIEREEAEAEERRKAGRTRTEEKKLTGRQLWESGLAGRGDEIDVEADGEDALSGMDRLKVNG